MPRLVEVSEASPERWGEIAAACDHATWFHTHAWAEFWQAESGLRPRGFLFRFDDNSEALVPASEDRALAGLVRHTVSSATGKYGGWISDRALAADAAAQVWGWLARRALTLRRNPFCPEPDGLPWTRPDFTQAIDLEPGFDALMRGWSKKHLGSLAKAGQAGVSAREAGTPEEWREYFAIYQDSVRRWGDSAQAVHAWSVFERLQALPAGTVRLWLAMHDGRAAAGAICFYHRRHVVYWHGASREDAMAHCPAFALLQLAMRHACDAGYRWFDFNPSGGLQGVVHFKAGFGAQRLDAGVYDRRPALVRALRGVRDLVRGAR